MAARLARPLAASVLLLVACDQGAEPTSDPYDPSKSAGGSSGGAGAALAARMLPIADGSDLGGSLRNPANFNNVTALRPTVGLVPTAPTQLPLLGFSVNGPLAPDRRTTQARPSRLT